MVQNNRKLNENSATLWHKRLGHISKQRIQRLVLDEILDPLDLSDFEVCIECIKGKQTNIRKLGAERAKDVLELVHTDICGPFPTTSWNGQQYFICGPFLRTSWKGQALNIFTFGVVQLRHGLIGHMKESWTQEQLAVILLAMLNALGAINFTIPP